MRRVPKSREKTESDFLALAGGTGDDGEAAVSGGRQQLRPADAHAETAHICGALWQSGGHGLAAGGDENKIFFVLLSLMTGGARGAGGRD